MIEKFVENTVNTENGKFRRLIFGIKLIDGSIIPLKGSNFKGEEVTFIYEKLIYGEWMEVDRPECFTPQLSGIGDLIKNNNRNKYSILEIRKRLRKCC